MSTKFKVFNEKEFAHRKNKPDKYVCYRTVLSHALLKKLRCSSVEDAKKAVFKLQRAVNNKESFTDNDFVFLYPINMASKIGFLMIDKSEGYYPLVFYPFNIKGETRTMALKMVLKDMTDNIDDLLSILNKQKSWNNKLQASLQDTIFHYVEDRKKIS